jgi:hypothetical protein
MRLMFTQAFATITLFFTALERFASAFNHVGAMADESAGALADQIRYEREQKIAEHKAKQIKAVK